MEPILSLEFTYGYDDIKNSWKISTKDIHLTTLLKKKFIFCLYIAAIISVIILTFTCFYYNIWNLRITIMIIILWLFLFFPPFLLLFIKKIAFQIIIKKTFKNCSKPELAKILIPCKFDFYADYLIRTIPSIQEKSDGDIMKNLLLKSERRFDYSKLFIRKKNIYFMENKEYIIFIPNLFISKKNLSQEDYILINKIKNDFLIGI